MKFECITESQKFSQKIITLLCKDLEKSIKNENISVIITGSFARGEANKF